MQEDLIPEANYAYRVRPGVVTGLGTTSIVIASLALLMAPMGVLWAVVIFGANRTAASARSTMVMAQRDMSQMMDEQLKMSDGEADAALRVLSTVSALTPDQSIQLRAILKDLGKEILPSAVSDAAIFNAVSDSGALKDSDGSAIGVFLILSSGKLEIYEDKCVFTGTGGAPLVSVAGVPRRPGIAAASSMSGGHIAAILERAQRIASAPLTQVQVDQLRTELQKPEQMLLNVMPSRSATANQLLSVQVSADGNAYVVFTGGTLNLLADGNSNVVLNNGPALRGGAMAMGASGTIWLSIALLIFTLIAIYLLVTGILTLRSSRLGARLHYIYCAAMLPAAVLLGVGLWMFIIDVTMTSPTGTTAASSAGAMVSAIVIGFLALLHPAMVLILLQTNAAQDFYRPNVPKLAPPMVR